MNLHGDPIPGFHGNKISVPSSISDLNSALPEAKNGHKVIGVVYLNPVTGVGEDDGPLATVTTVVGDDAFSVVMSAGIGLNRYAPSWKARRFKVVTHLCQGPVLTITFVPGRALPVDLARRIQNSFRQTALLG
jgi:hypothetical protein